MHRFKKYSDIKFNNIAVDRNLLDCYINNKKDVYLSNEIIKETTNYILYKENFTKVYVMHFKKLFIIHFKKSDEYFKEFEYLYNDSFYHFKVYETKSHYHVFCISKYLTNFTPLFISNFLKANECDYKYSLLHNVYDSFLIVNNGVKGLSNLHENLNDRYVFYKYLGKGNVVNNIEFDLNEIIKIINKNFMTFLPPHYMNI